MIHCRRDRYYKDFFSILLGLFGACCIGLSSGSEHPLCPLLAAGIGYTCILFAMSKRSTVQRGLCTGWILLSIAFLLHSNWFLSHPFSYIIAVWILLSILFALPYAGFAAWFLLQPPTRLRCLGFAAFFATLEHLFASLPCGYSFQCAALHLTGGVYAIQLASFIGGIGLSFIVYLSNLLFFRAVQTKSPWLAVCVFLSPYLLGNLLYLQRTHESTDAPLFTVAICHFENAPHIDSCSLPPQELHEREWHKVFQCLMSIRGQPIDLIVLPEGSLPFAADSLLYHSSRLPSMLQERSAGYLSSLDLSAKLAAYCKAPLLIGLEGRQISAHGEYVSHNSCFYVREDGSFSRYDKQLLLPLGEYIPFSFLKSILSSYGIHAGFTPGEGPTIFPLHNQRIAPLICYEETFSSYARKAYSLHPTILVGLSNDVWYPTVRYQHFELARLRAAELGLPLIRSCNYGISAAVDANGKIVKAIGLQEAPKTTCFIAHIPLASHHSLFASIGERIEACMLALLGAIACFYECRNGFFHSNRKKT